MRKFLLFLVPLLIGTGLFYWVIRTVGWQEIKNSFLVFTGWQGLVILGLTLLMAVFGTLIWHEALKGIGAKTSFRKLLQAYLSAFTIRYLFPVAIVGSEIFQGHILKEIDSVSWEKSIASVILNRILELTANMVVIFFGILFFVFKIALPRGDLIFLFSGLILALTFLISYFYFKSIKKESMVKAVGRIFNKRLSSEPLGIEKEIFSFFKLKNVAMWKSFIFSFLRAGAMWFRTWLLVFFLGKSLGAMSALAISAFYCLATMIPIPADLGSHEVVQAFAFSSLGLKAGTGTAFSLIVKGAELILSLIGMIILLHLGVEFLKNTLFRKNGKIAPKIAIKENEV